MEPLDLVQRSPCWRAGLTITHPDPLRQQRAPSAPRDHPGQSNMWSVSEKACLKRRALLTQIVVIPGGTRRSKSIIEKNDFFILFNSV